MPAVKHIRRMDMATDFRKQILDRLKQLNRTPYWLGEQLGGDPSSNAVYGYLHRDPSKRTDMKASHVEKILDFLETQRPKGK